MKPENFSSEKKDQIKFKCSRAFTPDEFEKLINKGEVVSEDASGQGIQPNLGDYIHAEREDQEKSSGKTARVVAMELTKNGATKTKFKLIENI
jgi:hypothetical protein